MQVAVFRSLTLVLLVVLMFAGAWLVFRRHERVAGPGVHRVESLAEAKHPPPRAKSLAPVDSLAGANQRVRLEEGQGVEGAEQGQVQVRDEAHFTIHVVARETGAGLAGVAVALKTAEGSLRTPDDRRSRGRAGEVLMTDAEGWAEFAVPADELLELRVNPFGDTGSPREERDVPALASDERRELVVELPTTPDLVWHGRIVDGESGAPLSGAAVWLVAENPFTGPTVEPVRLSAAAGGVQLAFASWESSYARVEHPGYASAFVHLGPGHEQPSASLTVLLFRAAALELTVSDKGTTPRTRLGASVSAEPWERIQGNQSYPIQPKGSAWTVHPDARGRCVFEDLPANIALTVELFDGFVFAKQVLRSERALRLEPGERRELNWTVGSGCTVDGLVLEADGRPAAGVEVWLLPDEGDPYFERYHDRQVVARARSAENGSFVLADVAVGSWLIGPAPKQRRRPPEADEDASQVIAPVATGLLVTPEQSHASVALTCWRGLTIRGTVLGPAGELIKGCSVTAFADGILVGASARAGSFILGPLAPGSYRVTASKPDFADSEPVSAVAGTDDLVLKLRRGTSVSVTVIDSRGNPAVNAWVWMLREQGSDDGSIGTSTGSDGEVQLHGIVAGSYSFSTSIPAGEFALARDVVLSSEREEVEIELRLEPAARLRIRVLPAFEKDLGAMLRKDGLPIGLALLGGDPLVVVPPGQIEVELTRGWGPRRRSLQRRTLLAVTGEEAQVEFDLDAPPR